MIAAAAIAFLLAVPDQVSTAACNEAEAIVADSTPAIACEKAIAGARDEVRARLLFQRGYIRNGKGDSIGALVDLDASVAANPDDAEVLRERAYTHNELGNYAAALADLNKAATRGVETASLLNERALSRLKLGDIAGAIADLDRALALAPDDGAGYNARANDMLWAGRFDDARADLSRARAIAEAAGDADIKATADKHLQRLTWMTEAAEPNAAAVCRSAQKANDFGRKGLIATCTAAYLAAPSGKEKAEMLTIRSVAWLYAGDDRQATQDRQMAVALDPGNAAWHLNLGFAYLNTRHSWAAEREFDRALAIKRTWFPLGGRAQARYDQGNVSGAFADAKRSFEMQPNEIALVVLGDLSYDQKDTKDAGTYWMAAYRMGRRGDDMLERLKKIGITEPAKEPEPK